MIMNETIAELLAWAEKKHADTGQTYGDMPYGHHLRLNILVAEELGFRDDLTKKIAITHDLIEDTDETIDTLSQRIGDEAALIVWAMSGGEGNRKARMMQIKNRIQLVPRAALYKAIDRIVNAENSRDNNPNLFKMYQTESPDFLEYITPLIPIHVANRLISAHE